MESVYKDSEALEKKVAFMKSPKERFAKEKNNEKSSKFNYEDFEKNMDAAAKSLGTNFTSPESIDTIKSSLDNMFNSLNFSLQIEKEVPEILNYLKLNDYITFLHILIMQKVDSEINSCALKILALILMCKINHPIFDNESMNTRFVEDLFMLSQDPSICTENKMNLDPSSISISSVFSQINMPVHQYEYIRRSALTVILMILQRNSEILEFAASNSSFNDILTSFEDPNYEIITLVCNIFQIYIERLPNHPETDIFVEYIIYHAEINYKLFLPALNGILSYLHSPDGPRFATELATSQIAHTILRSYSNYSLDFKKVISKIISQICKKSETPKKNFYISKIDVPQFFTNITDPDAIINSINLIKSILVHNDEISNEFMTISIKMLFESLNNGVFQIKRKAFVTIGRIIDRIEEQSLISLVNNYQLLDLVENFVDEHDQEALLSSCLIMSRLLVIDNEDIRNSAEGAFFSGDIIDTVESFEDSDNTLLQKAVIRFLMILDERSSAEN